MSLSIQQPASSNALKTFPRTFGVHPDVISDALITLLITSLALLLLALAGCGSGGYAGGSIEALSTSSLTLDAGQSYMVTATLQGSPTVTYSLAGNSCSSAGACGTLSSSTGASTVYTAPAGLTSPMAVTLTAAVAGTRSASTVAITVNPDPTLGNIPAVGTVGVPYTGSLNPAGGTAPLTLTVPTGSLPPGLSLNTTTGAITGTPTTAGTYSFTAQLTDSSIVPDSVTAQESITVSTPLSLAGAPPSGMVGAAYTTTFTGSGGTAPYTYSLLSGTLPAGLTLSAAGVLSGTPATSGTSNFSIQVQDSAGNKTSAAYTLSITATALSLTLSSLPSGVVGTPYSSTIGVSGGTAPYTCTIESGTLQAGLSLSGCVVSGTPSAAGTANLTVKATDSSNPQESTTGPVSLTINPALSVSSTLPNGTVGAPYSSPIGVSGGTGPYSCSITTGTLPAGLSLNGCVVSGTPTTAGASSVTVKATDSSSPQGSASATVSIAVNPAGLSLTTSSLPNGTVGTPYSSPIGVSGGTAPYTCMVTAGTLPAGLSLSGCLVSGTPTVAGTANLTVKATDSGNPQESTTGPVSLTIGPAASGLTLSSPAPGTINTPYTGTIGVSGGTAPYTCTVISGALQAGLSVSNCTITGTPTASGTANLTVKVSDSSSPAGTTTGPVAVVINPASSTLTLSSPTPATVATPYTGTIGVSGGASPYTCTVNSGTLPAGLSISNCTISGTPTTAGSTAINVTATDSSHPAANTTGPVTVTVNPVPMLTLTGSIPNATLGTPYTQTLTAQGGLAPYTYAITAGALPAGLTLSSTGIISGTPTAAGASSFTVTATDSESTPQTASLPLVLQVVYPPTANDSLLDGPYAYLFQGYDDVTAGVFAYQTATVGSFTADGAGGISAGELDANHQSSTAATQNSTNPTVSSSNFIGTYTIGSDRRGSLTLTVLNADGSTGATTTYAIAVQAPVAPATQSAAGSLIESDENQVVGTKGSGTFLAQTATAFSAGLNGSYAFGMSGDTPCLPSCTTGIIAGPVATVGEFSADGSGAISSGMADVNIASTNIPNSVLSGTYGSADANGRLQLSLTNAGTTGDSFPTDFAVYVVNANQAFLLSTDVHSSYILLAGSAQLQTQSTFSNASMNGPFIGYETSSTDPGLLGATLQQVLNYSTATIFRGVGASNGNCDITNVDTGGVTALISSLSGTVGGASGLDGQLLGAYTHTGATTCAVASDGRGVLQYPVETTLGLPVGTPPAPRVFYLSSPNAGYFLETSYAGLGKIEAQTGAPFSEANTFTGTYVYGSAPASSLASIDSSGVIVSNGAGTANLTLDMNVGVGTVNAIELDQTSTQPYTAPDPTSGRFTLGSAGNLVIYAINPNRFVLLDTNPATTSPSVALLY